MPRRWSLGILRSIGVVGAVLILHYLGWLRPFERPISLVLRPVQAWLYQISSGMAAPAAPQTVDVPALQARLQSLEVENERLRAEIARRAEAQRQLDFLSSHGLGGVVAEVIGEEVTGRFTTLVVGRGSRDGIRIGVPVIVHDGIIIGTVVTVQDAVSHVMLLSDPRSQTAGAVETGNERVLGVVTGELGLGMRMELVPKDSQVEVGDVVTSAGLERRIPRGLLIGHVAKLEPDTTGFFYRALIQSPVRVTEVSLVSIPASP